MLLCKYYQEHKTYGLTCQVLRSEGKNIMLDFLKVEERLCIKKSVLIKGFP